MDYGSVVSGAWEADPGFVALCKRLWGPEVTAEQVIAFAKDGPDASAVHVPGNARSCSCAGRCKHKGLPVLDDRGITKAASPTYERTIPKADRQFKRDDHGRFSSVGEIATNATAASIGAIGSGLGLNRSRQDVGRLARLISELKQTSTGRMKLARALGNAKVAGDAGRLGLLGAGSAIVGAAAAYHGKEAYEGIKDHAELESEHARHLAGVVRGDDVRSYVHQQAPRDLHVRTRGARRDAVTNAFAREAHPEDVAAASYHDTPGYRRRQDGSEQNAHRWAMASSFGKSLDGQLTQVVPDKHQVFGWASIVEKDGEPVVDLQGDYITIDELEKSAYEYVHKSRIGGAMHRRVGPDGQLISKADSPYHAADLIESFVVTPEKIEKMGLPPSTPVGWWVGFKVNDPEVWDSVKSGDWKGFSIHGQGRRKAVGGGAEFDISSAELTPGSRS